MPIRQTIPEAATRPQDAAPPGAFRPQDHVRSVAPSMRAAYAIAEQVARGDNTSVLIAGESGTGKEYFANLIHGMSARRDQPFVEIHCSAIPSELLESELFGHEKGAFTDARAQKPGLLELADGGTVFLDEIGETNPMLQVKLLRVLERRTFKRVGGTRDISVNVRVMSATNQDLECLMHSGRFREDLYYRLKVVPLHLPPLRERREDILPLARLFMERFSRQFEKEFREISPSAERVLLDYPWPGNIRELRNLFERTTLLESGPVLEPWHLALPTGPIAPPGPTLGQRIDQALTGAPPGDGIACESLMDELERALLLHASRAARWNRSGTARLLRMNRDKLRYRMKLHQLRPDPQPDPERKGSREGRPEPESRDAVAEPSSPAQMNGPDRERDGSLLPARGAGRRAPPHAAGGAPGTRDPGRPVEAEPGGTPLLARAAAPPRGQRGRATGGRMIGRRSGFLQRVRKVLHMGPGRRPNPNG